LNNFFSKNQINSLYEKPRRFRFLSGSEDCLAPGVSSDRFHVSHINSLLVLPCPCRTLAAIAGMTFYLMSFKIKLAGIAGIFPKLSRIAFKNLKKQSY
jgi:hypothetical protein